MSFTVSFFFFNDTATTEIYTLTHSFPTRRSSDLVHFWLTNPLSCFYGNPHRRLSTESGSRIRAFPVLHNSASTFPCMFGFGRLRFRASARKHASASTLPRLGGKAASCILGFVGIQGIGRASCRERMFL